MTLFAPVFAFLVSCVLTLGLARLARGAFLDRPTEHDRERKPQARGVPLVGGTAIFLTLVGAGALGWLEFRFEFVPCAIALAAVFVVGLVDDLLPGGLKPDAKVGLQVVALVPLLFTESVSGAGNWWTGEGELLVASVLAMNVANTWDHHDGALGTLAAFGFANAWSAPFACAIAGFLPWNLDAKFWEGPGATPTAYLGDGGSHLLGLAAILVPGAGWWLALPALDLARLSIVRFASGSRPWIGDRRHLSHLLARRIEDRRLVALVTTGIAAPSILLPALGGAGWVGVVLTGLALGWAVVWSGK